MILSISNVYIFVLQSIPNIYKLIDAHRQRIVNWINATGGTSSAFDITTKVLLRDVDEVSR
jgi:hypothetical protein